MRSLLIGIIASTLTVAPAMSQQIARVTVSAQVVVPEIFTLHRGTVSDGVTANGERTRQTSLYVTANRSWVLSIWRACGSTCDRLQVRVMDGARAVTPFISAGTTAIMRGEPGSAIPVTVELLWDEPLPAPDPSELAYLIARADPSD
jgi:hypothetical protein